MRRDTQARMAAAYAELVAAGLRPTTRAIQERAGVSSHTAVAFLRRKREEGESAVPPLPDELAVRAAEAATAQYAELWTVAYKHARRAAHRVYSSEIEHLRHELDEAKVRLQEAGL